MNYSIVVYPVKGKFVFGNLHSEEYILAGDWRLLLLSLINLELRISQITLILLIIANYANFWEGREFLSNLLIIANYANLGEKRESFSNLLIIANYANFTDYHK